MNIFMSRHVEKYGFTVQEPAELFMVWLGKGYEQQKELAKELLEHVADHTVNLLPISES